VTDADAERVVTETPETGPKTATHRSTRGMAKAAGVSQSAIRRIWRAFEQKPHRSDTLRLSTDPHVVDKVRHVVGLYLPPPGRAVVRSADERSQVRALDRTPPVLPRTPAQVERGPTTTSAMAPRRGSRRWAWRPGR